MRQIVFATHNKGKLREASEILGYGFSLVTPSEIGLTEDIPETGKTLEENSMQKARYIFEHKSCDCFSDDTGLEVEALGGAPGVYTARFAGPDKDFNKNMDKVLSELAHQESIHPGISRRARFRSVVTLILDGQAHQFEGVLNGTIARAKSGHGGFGYDPIFIPDEYPDRTLADISEEQKNDISHRGKALSAMAAYIAGIS
ncbi:MAG: RdgB/HAM1 family non-canonical purine NTP pyrophosphatase [Bacteroidales bacterium]|jgi:XTP/dITP diphosphohydrolase|nr:RdgB/HAM1 family non-canonical purine NTP pyrophosphatase [Bacteroidales bacterium]MCI2133674.1 RdgB/HAM1 family non-canonical purine NTP pyrophosphatase [Bacteroidales bacterium]